jgi:hypothetical protein
LSEEDRHLGNSTDLERDFPTANKKLWLVEGVRADLRRETDCGKTLSLSPGFGEIYFRPALETLVSTGRSNSSLFHAYRQEDLRQNPGVWIPPSAIVLAAGAFSLPAARI